MYKRNDRKLGAVLLILAVLLLPLEATADEANGTVNFKGKTATLKYAYLVRGPDSMDPETIIRQVILSQTDLSADIQACTTLSCCTNNLTEGVSFDLDAGPRLNYWVALNDQMIQHSGTKPMEVLAATSNESGHLAGTLSIDDSAGGGPVVEVVFDAKLLKEFDSNY